MSRYACNRKLDERMGLPLQGGTLQEGETVLKRCGAFER